MYAPSSKPPLQGLPGRFIPLKRSQVPAASIKPHRYGPRLISFLGYISLTLAGCTKWQVHLAYEHCKLENRNLSTDEVNVDKILGRLPWVG